MEVNKLNMGIMGKNRKPKSIKKFGRRIIRNLDHFISIVEQRGLATEISDEIIKMAKGYPDGALDHLYHNLDHVISQCADSQVASRATTPQDIDLSQPIVRQPIEDEYEATEKQPKWTTVPANEVRKPVAKAPPRPAPAPQTLKQQDQLAIFYEHMEKFKKEKFQNGENP